MICNLCLYKFTSFTHFCKSLPWKKKFENLFLPQKLALYKTHVNILEKANFLVFLRQTAFFSTHSLNNTIANNHLPEENKLTPFLQFDQALKNELASASIDVLPINSVQFSDYINSSKILQSLVLLGVNLAEVQKNCPESLKFLIKLDFNHDIKHKIKYLQAIGITAQEFGPLLTKNMLLLDPEFSLTEIKENVDYMISKKFKKKEIASIISRYPQFLNVPFVKLDGILGFYQNLPSNYNHQPIYFNGNDMRSIIVKCPQLVTATLEAVFLVVKSLQMSCEFTRAEIRELVLRYPHILLFDLKKIEALYKFWANEMNLSNDQIVKNWILFNVRLKKIRNRHFFLKHLQRNVYVEHEPGYISPTQVVKGTDEEFCQECCSSSLKDYEKFLKTL